MPTIKKQQQNNNKKTEQQRTAKGTAAPWNNGRI